jgi:hypothetical protein
VVLIDLDPPKQKTYPDFLATKLYTGVDAVCPTTLIREGKRLFRKVDGKLVQVKRFYNRVVFDELEAKKVSLPFAYTDELDVSWCSHPNWYWTWSKYTLPFVDHSAVPRARYLSELEQNPGRSRKLRAQAAVLLRGLGREGGPDGGGHRGHPGGGAHNWILQEKIVYEPGITMPTGDGVKAEVRMMFLRAPDEAEPTLVLQRWCACRAGRCSAWTRTAI